MIMKDFENEWKLNLSSILDELSDEEFEKLFLYLGEIPRKMKNKKYRARMPEIIIQRYGLHESIKVISKAMDGLPRKDCDIQDLIQPMMKKLEALNQQDTKNKQRSAGAAGGENVQSPGRPLKRKRQPNPQPEMDSGASMKAKRKKTNEKDSSLIGSSAALQKTFTPCLTNTIRDLKASGDLDQNVLTVKVVQKSDLYQSKNKKVYFHLGVADETDIIKAVVFGRERFPDIKTGHFYIIRNAPMNRQEKVLTITDKTKMSETIPFEVPRNVELEAEKLIFSPVYSIREIQSFGDKKEVSVEGTVKEIGVIKPMQIKKKKRMKKDKQDFELDDGTGSIIVNLWGEDIKHLRGISSGDVVVVNNLLTNCFKDTVSLNSTNSIRITKVQSAQVQDENIKILGIGKIDRINAELEVQINNQVKTLEVSCLLLAKAFGLHVKDDLRAKLLKKLELKAKAQIKGNNIIKLKAVA